MSLRWAQWGASGVPVFEGANKLVLIRNVQCVCCSHKHVCCINFLNVDICNMHVDICNMHVDICNMHVDICNMHVGKMPCQHAAPFTDGELVLGARNHDQTTTLTNTNESILEGYPGCSQSG